jgi:hypothetical protein
MHITLRIEELRHPDFFPQNSRYLCHFLLRPSLALAIGWLAHQFQHQSCSTLQVLDD